MPIAQPLKLKLDRDLRERMDAYILEVVQSAVSDSKIRDEDLIRWRDGLHGISTSYTSSAWENSCQIEDGLIQEQRAQMVAQIMAAANRYPLVTAEGTDDLTRPNASHLETYLSQTMKRRRFPKAFYEYADHAVCYPAGVLCVEWAEDTRKKREIRYWDGVSLDSNGEPVLVQGHERDPEFEGEYQQVPVWVPAQIRGGHSFRAVAPWNFYMFPADAPSVEDSLACMERRYYSENELLNGIAGYGFDEDAVMDTIEYGSRSRSDSAEDARARGAEAYGVEGGSAEAQGAQPFECFVWYGNLPKFWEDGRAQLPKHLWNDLFCAVVCPATQTVLKLDFAPDDEYPYQTGSMHPEADSPYGMGLCLLLESEQQEATHYRRLAANCADLVAAPVTIMADGAWDLNKNASIYPGAILREEEQGSIRPYEMPSAPTVIATQMLDYTLQRAQRKTAAQGFGQVNPKQPLVAEMEGVMAATDTKFNFFQANVFAILPWVAKRMVKLELQYNPDFQLEIDGDAEAVTLTADALAGQYEYNVAQLDQNASEAAKVQRDVAVSQLVDGFFKFLMETMQTPLAVFAQHKWRQTRDALSHLSVRKPEDYIGPLPPAGGIMPPMPPAPIDPMQMIQGVMGGGASGVNAGAGAPSPMGVTGGQRGVAQNGFAASGSPV